MNENYYATMKVLSKLNLPEGTGGIVDLSTIIKARDCLLRIDPKFLNEKKRLFDFLKLHEKVTFDKHKKKFENFINLEKVKCHSKEKDIEEAFIRIFSLLWGVNIYSDDSVRVPYGAKVSEYNFELLTHQSVMQLFEEEPGFDDSIVDNISERSQNLSIRDSWSDPACEVLLKVNFDKSLDQIFKEIKRVYIDHKLQVRDEKYNNKDMLKIERVLKKNYETFYTDKVSNKAFSFSPRKNWLELYFRFINEENVKRANGEYGISNRSYAKKNGKVHRTTIGDIPMRVRKGLRFFQKDDQLDFLRKNPIGRLYCDIIFREEISEKQMVELRNKWLSRN